jgi:hypothetical protein
MATLAMAAEMDRGNRPRAAAGRIPGEDPWGEEKD